MRSFLFAFLLMLSPQILYADDTPRMHLDPDTVLAFNRDGDTLYLLLDTQEVCPDTGQFDAYAMKPDMTATAGCWQNNKTKTGFLINWGDGNTVSVSTKTFKFVKAKFI